ncbi:hypothetical protein Syun_026072 [Stephania yunnanensis]|uniref:Uncharacterized protein n=1 Tax=Stephania yunnanensis TaxID=152371 RepID=A0AAP0HVD6_9MAGN
MVSLLWCGLERIGGGVYGRTTDGEGISVASVGGGSEGRYVGCVGGEAKGDRLWE